MPTWTTPLRPLRRLWLWWTDLDAQFLFVSSFLVLIAVGTAGLLFLPGLFVGPRLGFLDALFTMTSAVCVTGLTVVDTATYFTGAGQLWLLLFIQLGGLGVFSLTTLIIGGMGRRLSLRTEILSGPSIELTYRRSVVSLTMAMARFTFLIEGMGALFLFFLWVGQYGMAAAAWHAVFHSVSAFCNAGFSTFSSNLVGFASQPLTLLTLSALVVLGGLGYLSVDETVRWHKAGGLERRRRLSSHTFSVLLVSGCLLAGGTVLIAAFEWNGVLAHLGPVDKIANALTMSVMPRTAGFNSVSYSEVGNAAAYLTVLLMVVGGSPGSTAGGIKTTALAVLVALAISRVRGRRHVTLHGRWIPDVTVVRTVSLTLVAFAALTVAVFVLGFSETLGVPVEEARKAFLPQLFEAASALGTVGLSMDLTPTLSPVGKVVDILLMFIGRVGPLSFFAAVALKGSEYPRDMRPAREDIIVG